MEKILWVNDAQHRYFLIPEERELSVGPMVLRTLAGQEQFVASAAAIPYEISAAEAEQHLEDQIDQAMQRTQLALSQVLVTDPGSWDGTVDPRGQQEALRILSAVIGTSPTDLQRDPEQLREYLHTFMADLRSGLEAGFADPAALDAVQGQMDRIQAHLQQQRIPFEFDLRSTVEQLQTRGGSEAEMEQVLEQLQPLILLLKHSIMESPELQAALADLVPTASVPPADPRLQEEYRQSARRAVSAAMQHVQVPKFDFNSLSQPRSVEGSEDPP